MEEGPKPIIGHRRQRKRAAVETAWSRDFLRRHNAAANEVGYIEDRSCPIYNMCIKNLTGPSAESHPIVMQVSATECPVDCAAINTAPHARVGKAVPVWTPTGVMIRFRLRVTVVIVVSI